MFFDEGRFGLQPVVGRRWSLKGKRPVALTQTRYSNFYIYSAVSSMSGEHFSLMLPWVNTQMMNTYLEEMAKAYPDKHIILIMDQAGWHKSKDLHVPSKIELIYLPPYSPELNPVERLWLVLRRAVCRNRLFDSEESLCDALCEHIKNFTNATLQQLCRCEYLFQIN